VSYRAGLLHNLKLKAARLAPCSKSSAIWGTPAVTAASRVGQLLCRFLDAGNDERCLALRRLASKKRQGTKSREAGHWLSSEHYGDLIFAPALMGARCPASGDLHGRAQGSLETCNGYLGRRVDRIDERSARLLT
jgi:hypothetical protein